MSETDIETIERLNRELTAANRRATDSRYMAEAYQNMLGPTGRRVAAMWAEKRVHRVHYDWGPKGVAMTGEERAQAILEMEDAMKTARAVEFVDSVLPRSKANPPTPITGETTNT
jgi:hypothetical protein